MKWSAQKVCDVYDSNPDMILRDLSRLSGWSVPDLISLLTEHTQ